MEQDQREFTAKSAKIEGDINKVEEELNSLTYKYNVEKHGIERHIIQLKSVNADWTDKALEKDVENHYSDKHQIKEMSKDVSRGEKEVKSVTHSTEFKVAKK